MSAQATMDRVTNEQLIEALVDMEDEVPRTIIDECARRGEPMAQTLIALINDEYSVNNDELHLSQWPRLHALMILGLSTSDCAGRALLSALKTAAAEQDEFLTGWLAGFWPALFCNKSFSCVADLPKLIDNPKTNLYLRIAGTELILSFAHRAGAHALDKCLQWIASFAANEQECLEFRLLMAIHLLNFPRHEHRKLVEQLAGQQCIVGPMYSAEDIQSAYDDMQDIPVWNRFTNPWEFYSPEAIAQRAKRWTEQLPDELSLDIDPIAD